MTTITIYDTEAEQRSGGKGRRECCHSDRVAS